MTGTRPSTATPWNVVKTDDEGDQYLYTLWTCDDCGALIPDRTLALHAAWHEKGSSGE